MKEPGQLSLGVISGGCMEAAAFAQYLLIDWKEIVGEGGQASRLMGSETHGMFWKGQVMLPPGPRACAGREEMVLER